MTFKILLIDQRIFYNDEESLATTAGIAQLGCSGNLTMKKLHKNTCCLTVLEGIKPNQTIPPIA